LKQGFDILFLIDGSGRSPGITVNKQSLSFAAEGIGHMSDPMTILVSGSNLQNNIVISAGSGFIINLDGSTTDAGPITLTQSGGIVTPTTVYVRFFPSASISYASDVDIMSTGATTKVVHVTGTGATPSVYASVFSLSGLTYDGSQGPSAASATFSISGVSLSPAAGNVTVMPSSSLEVYDGSAWQSTAFTISYVGSTLATASVYKVRLKAGLSPDDYNFETVTLTGGGSSAFVIAVMGTVVAPTITISQSSFTFADLDFRNYYAHSDMRTYNVSAHALYGNLTIAKPTGYIINQTGSFVDAGPITLVPDGSGDISSTPIYVMLFSQDADQSGTLYSGNVSNSALHATTKNIALLGTAYKSVARDIFNYTHFT
jgi:hypothetical protein